MLSIQTAMKEYNLSLIILEMNSCKILWEWFLYIWLEIMLVKKCPIERIYP